MLIVIAIYYVYTHWGNECSHSPDPLGRVGEKGQDNLDFYGSDLNSALRQFNTKFRAKTKLPFNDRQAPSRPGFSWSFVFTDL